MKKRKVAAKLSKAINNYFTAKIYTVFLLHTSKQAFIKDIVDAHNRKTTVFSPNTTTAIHAFLSLLSNNYLIVRKPTFLVDVKRNDAVSFSCIIDIIGTDIQIICEYSITSNNMMQFNIRYNSIDELKYVISIFS